MAYRWPSSPCVLVAPLYLSDTSHTGLGPILIILFSLTTFLKTPIVTTSAFGLAGGGEGTQFSPYQMQRETFILSGTRRARPVAAQQKLKRDGTPGAVGMGEEYAPFPPSLLPVAGAHPANSPQGSR